MPSSEYPPEWEPAVQRLHAAITSLLPDADGLPPIAAIVHRNPPSPYQVCVPGPAVPWMDAAAVRWIVPVFTFSSTHILWPLHRRAIAASLARAIVHAQATGTYPLGIPQDPVFRETVYHPWLITSVSIASTLYVSSYHGPWHKWSDPFYVVTDARPETPPAGDSLTPDHPYGVAHRPWSLSRILQAYARTRIGLWHWSWAFFGLSLAWLLLIAFLWPAGLANILHGMIPGFPRVTVPQLWGLWLVSLLAASLSPRRYWVHRRLTRYLLSWMTS